MRPAGAMRRARVELALERTNKRREQIKEQRIRRHDDLAQVILHQRAEHDRPQALLLGRAVDAPDRFLCLVNARHKWQSHRAKFQPLELRHETVAQCFRSHPRLVRDEKYRSTAHGAVYSSGLVRAVSSVSPKGARLQAVSVDLQERR